MSWQLFDRIRTFARTGGLYQQERLFQDQSSLGDIVAGGEFYDFSQQQALLDQTNTQINRLERYKDYDQMDEVGEISLALDLYSDEASLVDPERKHTIIIKAASKNVKEELEHLFFSQLLIDNHIRPIVRYLCKYGDCPHEIVPDINRDGVAALKFMNVYNFTRVETKHGDLVGFFYQDELSQEPVFLHPWQVMHLRLSSYENLFAPYGRSILEGSRKAFKQLRLMEDAALIYRITRAPEKRIYKIPVGNIPAKEVSEYIQMVARTFKKTKFYDPRTGTFNERYSPLIQEDDFFLPQRPDGTGPNIETLPGAENLDQIADIEYFKKKMIAPLKIPFARVGIGEGAGGPSDKLLVADHPEFAKAVQWVQREVVSGLTKVAICHLAMKGFGLDDIKGFALAMSATNAIDELYRMETWASRVGVMSDLKDLGWFPKEWIVSRFTDLSPDEIKEISEMDMEEDGDEEGGIGGLGGGLGGLGGGDLGGDDFDDLDMEDLGVGEEPASDMGGDIPEIVPEGEGGLDLPEHKFDPNLEKKLIVELRKSTKRDILNKLLESREKQTNSVHSQYQYLIDNNELDGLGTVDQDDSDNVIVDGKNTDDDKIIVESRIDKGERNEVISEYKRLIKASVELAEDDAEDDYE